MPIILSNIHCSSLIIIYKDYFTISLGIDVNTLSCKLAGEALSGMDHVVVKGILAQDVQTVIPVETYDLVIIVHTLYYIPMLEGALSTALKLTSDEGEYIMCLYTCM